MEEQYYIVRDGQQDGPHTRSTLEQWIASGQITKETQCWTTGMTGWQPVGVRLGLDRPAAAGNSGLAIASLVCGILGFCVVFVSIPAVICGHIALSRANRSGAPKGMATAGLVLGYLGMIVTFVALMAAIAVPSFLRARQRSQAVTTKNDLRLIESAVKVYATEYGLPEGGEVTWEQLKGQLAQSTRLATEQASVLGHPYSDTYEVGSRPEVPRETFEALSDVAPADFWDPFPVEGE